MIKALLKVDNQQRTNVNNVFAVGDVTGNPMLAHKSTYQGKVAAEVLAGMKTIYDAKAILPLHTQTQK